MTHIPMTNKFFSSRELSILQKLYRSRDFKSKLVSSPSTPISYTFLVYGSINTLSSTQRRAFRNHLNKNSQFNNVKVKLTLFSSTVAQYIRGFSSLQKLDYLIKGTTYQRVIHITDSAEASAYSQLFSFFGYLSTLKLTEETTFNFIPALVFASIKPNQGVSTPMRFYQRQEFTSTNGLGSAEPFANLIRTIEFAYTKVI
jgi:hypothetical protein